MATQNAVNTTLSGQTGTGSFVGSTSPTLVTPILGAASATSLSFTSTSGIIGTTTNNNAAALSVGEFVSSQVLFASATNISTTTATNLTSISLTAGDWDVWGNAFIAGSGVLTASYCGISSTSATLPDFSLVSGWNCLVAAGFSQSGLVAPTQRISLSGTTTIYLVTEVIFGSGTFSQSGFLGARRRR